MLKGNFQVKVSTTPLLRCRVQTPTQGSPQRCRVFPAIDPELEWVWKDKAGIWAQELTSQSLVCTTTRGLREELRKVFS
jgi:hypothetical protein